MEFRNQQHWIRHQSAQLKANPLAAFLFTVLFVALLIPLIALALLAFLLFLIVLPLRIAYLQWKLGRSRGRTGPGPAAGSPATPYPSQADGAPAAPGPVIDVEVTRSTDVSG